MKIYIDESGDLGFSPKSSQFYILAALILEQGDAEIRRCFKQTRQRKLKKSTKNLPEFKFSHLRDDLRHHILGKICNCNIEVAYAILRKKQVYPYLRQHPQKVNNYIAGQLIQQCCDHYRDSSQIEVIIDRCLNQTQQLEFNGYLEQKIAARPWLRVTSDGRMTIEHRNSFDEPGLQAVDLLAGAIHYWCREDDPCYMRYIEPRVVLPLDFFKPSQK